MSILDNLVVRKYFHCEHSWISSVCSDHMAAMILQAMQEPIRKGERRLYVDGMGAVWDGIEDDGKHPDFHPEFLRLPDKFQKRECEFEWWPCLEFKKEQCRHKSCKPKREEVEEKIKYILNHYFPKRVDLHIALAELARLAREGE